MVINSIYGSLEVIVSTQIININRYKYLFQILNINRNKYLFSFILSRAPYK